MSKFLILILLSTFPLMAENPLIFRRHFEGMATTDFSDENTEDQTLSAAIFEVELGSIIQYTPCYKEGVAITLGYEGTYFRWENQPEFNQQDYNNMTLTLYAFTARAEDWTWRTMIKARESIDNNNLEFFLTWDMFLWGHYIYKNPYLCIPLGLHFGVYAETGMKADRVYPILGVDFDLGERVSVNLVFPMDMSIVYQKSELLELACAVRFFVRRHRVGLQEPVPYAMWEWRGWGAEVGFNYFGWLKSRLNMHAGYQFGSEIRVSNRHRENPKHFHPNPSLYAGAEINFPI